MCPVFFFWHENISRQIKRRGDPFCGIVKFPIDKEEEEEEDAVAKEHEEIRGLLWGRLAEYYLDIVTISLNLGRDNKTASGGVSRRSPFATTPLMPRAGAGAGAGAGARAGGRAAGSFQL